MKFEMHFKWTCRACGSINHGDTKFCEFCGAPKKTDIQLPFMVEEMEKPPKNRGVRYCTACGAACGEEELFCPQCGERLTDEDADTGTPRQVMEPVGTPPEPQVVCPHCYAINSAQMRFCEQCGGDLQDHAASVCREEPAPAPEPAGFCPVCGAAIPNGCVFCLECGASLTGAREPAPAPKAKTAEPAAASKPTLVKKPEPVRTEAPKVLISEKKTSRKEKRENQYMSPLTHF